MPFNKKTKKQIASILEKRLEDICLEALNELPTKQLLPRMQISLPVSSLTGKDRSKVKKKWDNYLSSISTKRRMVRLEELEKHYLCEGKPYPKD